MQSHELLREVLQNSNPKMISAEMGLSLSMIYKWAEPDEGDGSGAPNPLDRVEILLRCTNDLRIVQWLCQRAGGFFIRNPKNPRPHAHQLIPATNQMVQEFADLLMVVSTAATDSQVTRKEAEMIRDRWEQLKTVTEEFVRDCEQGAFGALRTEAQKLAANPSPHPPPSQT
jgi:hypothetical protein